MPQYQKPFATLGATAGGAAGAAGGGLLGALGQLLEPLDMPRQALWNIPGAFEKFYNSHDVSDLAPLLPAVAGGMGAFIGGPLGAVLGAGVAQGAGRIGDHLTGQNRFAAPTAEDLYDKLDLDPEYRGAGSAILGMLGDPLMYAGGLGGARGGASAGAKYGKRLENVAAWNGPQYGDGGWNAVTDALGVGYKTAQHPEHLRTIQELSKSPLLEQMAKEVPPGSRHLGTGFETMALETPTGGVVSLRRYRPDMAGGVNGLPAPRPVSPDVVPAVRSKPFVSEQGPGFRVEHTPFSPDVVADASGLPGESPQLFRDRVNVEDSLKSALEQRLESQGENPFDLHFGNVGWGPEGKMLMRDPGASIPARGQAGLPRPEMLEPAQGNMLDNAILKLLGAKQSVRNEIIAGTPRYPSPYDAFNNAFTTPKMSGF